MALSALLALVVVAPGANALREILISETAMHPAFKWKAPESFNNGERAFAGVDLEGSTKKGKISVYAVHWRTKRFAATGWALTGPSLLMPETHVSATGLPLGERVRTRTSTADVQVAAVAGHYTVIANYRTQDRSTVTAKSMEFLVRRSLARALGLDTRAGSQIILNGKSVTTLVREGVTYASVLSFAVAKGWQCGVGDYEVTFETSNSKVIAPLASNKIKVGHEWRPAGGFTILANSEAYAPLEFLQGL